MDPKMEAVIVGAARAAGVDPKLALAVARVESAGDPLAVRYEPLWKFYFDVPQFAFRNRITQETERALQSLSWGLMQVMGSVARELGFVDSLIRLSDPQLGAKYGCLKLAQCVEKYPKLSEAIAAYNAGSPRRKDGVLVNQGYVEKVLRFYGGDPNGELA